MLKATLGREGDGKWAASFGPRSCEIALYHTRQGSQTGFTQGLRRREMKKLLVTASVALFAICAASADTIKDGAISVKPGKWLWKQEGPTRAS